MRILNQVAGWVALCGVYGIALPEAVAGPADDYVKGLVGKWRGGGTVTINDKGRKVRLRCVTNNTLNEATRTLTMNGRCATSERTRSLRGKIKYNASGSKLTAVNLSVAGRNVGRYSSLRGNTLTLRGSVQDKAKNKTILGRTFVRGGGRRFSIQLQTKESAAWKSRGILKFKR